MQVNETTGKEITTMKKYKELLLIWSMVLLGGVLFMSSDASAVIVGTAPEAAVGTTVVPSGFAPFGVAPRPAFGLTQGFVRPPFFNPFLIRPVFNPFFNPFLNADGLGVGLGLGLGVNPGFVD